MAEVMRLVIGTLTTRDTSNQQDQSYDHNLKLFASLSKEEHQRFLDVEDALSTFRSNSQLYRVIQWNYQDYHSVLNVYLNAYVNGDTEYLSAFPSSLGINRCLLNLLSSIRTYLDHTETRLSRRYGEASKNFVMFKKYCSDAYDGDFSYRFLYKLRNYAQHCELPIDSVTFNSRLNPENFDNPSYALEVGITRDRLLEDFAWKRLKEEVMQQPPLIDINSHVDTVARLVEGINANVTGDELPLLKEGASFVKELADRAISHAKYRGGKLYVIELPDDIGEAGLEHNMKFVLLPLEISLSVLDGKIEEII